jgi:hypothetical protein
VPEFNELKKGTHGLQSRLQAVLTQHRQSQWRPNVQSGFLRAILGDPDQATLARRLLDRLQPAAGRHRVSMVATLAGSISATRNNNGATYPLVGPGETWPVLFTETARLGPPPGIDTPEPGVPHPRRAR